MLVLAELVTRVTATVVATRDGHTHVTALPALCLTNIARYNIEKLY